MSKVSKKYEYNNFGKHDNSKALEEESQRRYSKWINGNHITKELEHGSGGWINLIPRKFNSYNFSYGSLDPHFHLDHSQLYETMFGERVFTTQPYWGAWGLVHINYINYYKKWASEKGLSARFSFEDSWHYPYRTILIEFRLIDQQKYVNYIKNNRIRLQPGYYTLRETE
jgi:hypothetical protein